MSQLSQINQASFKAPMWARNAHVQTIYPKFFMKTPRVSFSTQRIDTPDADFLDLGILMPATESPPQHIAVLFHGLEGSQNSHYIQHLASHLYTQNIGCIVMHFRGCSGQVNMQARAYHSGETSDAKHCLRWVSSQYPEAILFAVGFSLGGNMLLKLLGEQGAFIKSKTNISAIRTAENIAITERLISLAPNLRAAVSICAPIVLSASAEAINCGFAKLYQAHLLKSMQHNLLEKMALLDMSAHLSINREQVKAIASFREFDEHVTAKLHGFEGADDYYEKASAMQYLPDIQIPTLIVHAKDDPFMDDRVIPDPKQLSPTTQYELSQQGGHVGFMYGTPLRPRLWLPERIAAFLKEHL